MKHSLTLAALAGLFLFVGTSAVSAQLSMDDDDPVQKRIDGVLARYDTNKDGAVDEKEAGRMWARLAPADANEDGKVTAKEMREAWTSESLFVDDDDPIRKKVEGLLKKLDENKDGAIDRKEAGKMWQRLAPADANEDGKVTAKEMIEAWS